MESAVAYETAVPVPPGTMPAATPTPAFEVRRGHLVLPVTVERTDGQDLTDAEAIAAANADLEASNELHGHGLGIWRQYDLARGNYDRVVVYYRL